MEHLRAQLFSKEQALRAALLAQRNAAPAAEGGAAGGSAGQEGAAPASLAQLAPHAAAAVQAVQAALAGLLLGAGPGRSVGGGGAGAPPATPTAASSAGASQAEAEITPWGAGPWASPARGPGQDLPPGSPAGPWLPASGAGARARSDAAELEEALGHARASADVQLTALASTNSKLIVQVGA